LIGEQSVENLKHELATEPVMGSGTDCDMTIRGRSVELGPPIVLTLRRNAFDDVLVKHFTLVVEAVVDTLNVTPPELRRDILDRGIVLNSGSSSFRCFQRY
tara:strand:+ start:15869 stop:16171 length:303 start_codon:yes stop_codon:yes gene_type:complete